MSGQSCIVCKEHLAYKNLLHAVFSTKVDQVEETVIPSGVEIYSVLFSDCLKV